MPFIDLPDGQGKMFVPEKKKGAKEKHPCPDCFSCQMCSDDRCLQCRACEKAGRCLAQPAKETEGDG